MERAFLEERVKAILSEHLGVPLEEIQPETLLVPDESDKPHLNADSLDVVELIMAFEEEFTLRIDDDRAEEQLAGADVAKLVDFLAEQLAESA